MLTAATIATLLLARTSLAAPPPPPADAPSAPYRVETVAENLEVPWSIDFLPDGRILVTERPGRVRMIDADGKLAEAPVYTVPNVKHGRSEIGLMDLCLHPDYANNKLLYLSYGHTDGDIRVVRYRVDDSTSSPTFSEDRVIIKITPAGMNHAGCRMGFGPDGKLYITTGEAFKRELAQDLTSLGGKILRLNDDGAIPDDNPFVGRKDARPEIWSYGHRNPQGIDWQPGTGRLFETEHGPSGEVLDAQNRPVGGGDEVNIIEKGKNYGWPVIFRDQEKSGMVSPLVQWNKAIAPASGVFYNGDLFPQWKGNFLVGALGGLRVDPQPGIYRIELDGRRYVKYEVLVPDYGRIREVAVAPDGSIYFSTSNRDGRARPREGDDHIYRLVPNN